MAYTTKLLITDKNNIETDITSYLTTESPSTIHNISCFCRENKIYVIVVTE